MRRAARVLREELLRDEIPLGSVQRDVGGGGGRRGRCAGNHRCRAFLVEGGLERLVVQLGENEGRRRYFEFGSNVLHSLFKGAESVERERAGHEDEGGATCSLDDGEGKRLWIRSRCARGRGRARGCNG